MSKGSFIHNFKRKYCYFQVVYINNLFDPYVTRLTQLKNIYTQY